MSKKSVLLFGIFTFSILLILCLVFYKERTVFADLSLHIFCIVKDQSFAIQNNRFGAFITQLFPLLTVKFGGSLNTVLIVYSLSFIVLYFGTFLIILLLQKNTRVAFAYLITSILITSHTFYWVQSELPQAITLLFIYLGLADNYFKKTTTPIYWIITIPLLFLVCFTHPLMIFAITFSSVFLLLSYQSGYKRISVSLFIYYLLFGIKYFFLKTSYENNAIGGISNLVSSFPNYGALASNKNFLKYLLDDYYLLAISFAGVIFYYLWQQLYFKAILVIVSCIGYVLIVNTAIPNGTHQFYMENLYLLLTIFIGIPLAFDIVPAINFRKTTYFIFSLVIILSIVRIYNTSSMYTTRLNWIRMIIKSTEDLAQKKLVIRPDNIPKEILLMDWASCYEFWILSTVEGKESRSIIIQENKDEFPKALVSKNSFFAKWGAYNYEVLAPQYFKFNDTSTYVLYTYKK